jgi:hypothetical protein
VKQIRKIVAKRISDAKKHSRSSSRSRQQTTDPIAENWEKFLQKFENFLVESTDKNTIPGLWRYFLNILLTL